MSSMFQYWGRGTHMSVDLKQVIHRVRTSKPEYFAPRLVKEQVIDVDDRGVATSRISERITHKAVAPSGAKRHALSLQKERF